MTSKYSCTVYCSVLCTGVQNRRINFQRLVFIISKVFAVRGYKLDSLKALFTNLLNIYDSSENHHEAFSALVNKKCKFSCLHEIMEETLRLLSLSWKNDDQQSQLFVHSVENIVPKRVIEKLMDFLLIPTKFWKKVNILLCPFQ